MNNIYYYEHIGHMQFSVLTLKSLAAINDLVSGEIGKYVLWSKVQTKIEESGFSSKQATNELERFCYGFECLDKYNESGYREIMLTNVGRSFIDKLLSEAPYQSSQFAFLMRPAKKKRHWNVIIQETTFFNPEIYELIERFCFRKGPARDFVKCICIDDLLNLIDVVSDYLSPTEPKQPMSLTECADKVKRHGKYWASVGGNYSWFVFAQRYELPFMAADWECYDNLISELIRPTEWGGGKDIPYKRLLELIKDKDRFATFRNHGLFRPIWKSKNISDALFRLTAPGFLMWERKNKGFIYEFCLRRLLDGQFELDLCDASDSTINSSVINKQSYPSFIYTNSKKNVINHVRQLVDGKQLWEE